MLAVVASSMRGDRKDRERRTPRRYSVPLLVWARWGVPAVLIVALFGPKLCLGLLHTPRLKLHVVRGAVLMFSSLCFFAALKGLPLADATGLNYLTPVLVTVMAGWFLREQITWIRWIFVVVGFGGMLLIVQPGSGARQLSMRRSRSSRASSPATL